MSKKREKSIHIRISEDFYNDIIKNAKISYSSIVEFCRVAITNRIKQIENPHLFTNELNALDIRYGILKKVLKKLMIDNPFNSNLSNNHKIYKILKILNIFDNCSMNEYILPNSLNPNYHRLSQILFDCDLEGFKRKIRQKEIRYEKINRNIIILAGDIGLELLKFYENHQEKNPIKVADIHGPFMYKIQSSNEYFTETLYFDGFFKDALNLLESRDLVEKSGDDYNGDSSNTIYKIKDYVRLFDFIRKYSINYIFDIYS